MKKTISLFMLAASSLFGLESSVSSFGFEPESNWEQSSEPSGHITFRVGPSFNIHSAKNPLPVFSVGYQSKINLKNVLQSTRIEVGTGIVHKGRRKKGVYHHPKIMGIHYWNPTMQNRVFTAVGPSLSTYYDEGRHEEPKTSATFIGSSMAVGVEMGDPEGAINIISLSYDQPSVIVSDINDNFDMNGALSVSYIVGF